MFSSSPPSQTLLDATVVVLPETYVISQFSGLLTCRNQQSANLTTFFCKTKVFATRKAEIFRIVVILTSRGSEMKTNFPRTRYGFEGLIFRAKTSMLSSTRTDRHGCSYGFQGWPLYDLFEKGASPCQVVQDQNTASLRTKFQ